MPIIFYVLFAGGFLFVSIQYLKRALASQNWRSTRGWVTSSRAVDTVDYTGADGDPVPDIRYNYIVGGNTHIGKRISFGKIGIDKVARYPVNRNVVVYYDPKDPDQSVLEPGISAVIYLPLWAGIFFVCIPVVILIWSLLSGAKSPDLLIVLGASGLISTALALGLYWYHAPRS
jgi:hypothetical protein